MNNRRDFHRFEPWMDWALTAISLFLCVALIAAGHLIAGLPWGVVAVVFALLARH